MGPNVPTSIYLYGVTPWPLSNKNKFEAPGIGQPPFPVRAVPVRELAALVSEVGANELSFMGPRELRRDMKAHASLVNEFSKSLTILPAGFGTVLPSEDYLVHQFMEPQYTRLWQNLKRLEGAVELKLKATSREQEALRTVVSHRLDLRQTVEGLQSFDSRLEIGRRISEAIQELGADDSRHILENLAPIARAVSHGKLLSELMALNASFLVERHRLAQFDRAVEKLQREIGDRIEFDYVGPLAPYSFVDIRVA